MRCGDACCSFGSIRSFAENLDVLLLAAGHHSWRGVGELFLGQRFFCGGRFRKENWALIALLLLLHHHVARTLSRRLVDRILGLVVASVGVFLAGSFFLDGRGTAVQLCSWEKRCAQTVVTLSGSPAGEKKHTSELSVRRADLAFCRICRKSGVFCDRHKGQTPSGSTREGAEEAYVCRRAGR